MLNATPHTGNKKGANLSHPHERHCEEPRGEVLQAAPGGACLGFHSPLMKIRSFLVRLEPCYAKCYWLVFFVRYYCLLNCIPRCFAVEFMIAPTASHSRHNQQDTKRFCLQVFYSRLALALAVRISDFSKITTLGNWSADILVRSRRSVNPEADRNVRAGAGQNSSRAISNQGRAEVQGGRRDRWETPRASFIPAQGNALGSSAPKPISAESAIHPSSYQPPASHSASVPNVSFIELYETDH